MNRTKKNKVIWMREGRSTEGNAKALGWKQDQGGWLMGATAYCGNQSRRHQSAKLGLGSSGSGGMCRVWKVKIRG